MTSALNKYVFSCLPAAEKSQGDIRASPKHKAAKATPKDPVGANASATKAAAGATKAATRPKATNNPEVPPGHEGKPEIPVGDMKAAPEGKDRVRGDNSDSPGRDIKLEADTQVKLIEKHERDIKDKPPNEQINGFDIPDAGAETLTEDLKVPPGHDALYEKISTYEFPMERYYLNTKDARRRETLATTCRLSNQKITSALNGLIRGRV